VRDDESAPVLSAADRGVLSVMAEHVRDHAGLKYVAIFRHAAGSHTALEELARASTLGFEEMSRVRSSGHAAVRGMRRFARRAVTLEGGAYVVAAETGRHQVVSVVASGAESSRLPAEVNAALVDLAQVAARVLSEPGAQRAVEPPPATHPGQPPAGGVAYGARFGDALAFLQRPPILAETRWRLARAVEQRHAAVGEAIGIVETDVGLATAVLSAANRLPDRGRDGIASVPAAIAALGPRATLRLAVALPTLSRSGPGDRMSIALTRISAHAIATRSAADFLARSIGERGADELRLAATLHDIGKVALAGVSDGYLKGLSDPSVTPEARLNAERGRLTIDHAAMGALTLRRLGLPRSVTALVDRHHADDASGRVAIVRLADMLAHLANGDAVTPHALESLARRLSLDEDTLHAISYDLPRARGPREAKGGPSPLTPMQEKALRGIAEGKAYKQIAADLSLSESTVRSHLHNLYRKLDVTDRAQAVLLASERGWI
jgi:putative nucleotidyltransferase with HDIG domain